MANKQKDLSCCFSLLNGSFFKQGLLRGSWNKVVLLWVGLWSRSSRRAGLSLSEGFLAQSTWHLSHNAMTKQCFYLRAEAMWSGIKHRYMSWVLIQMGIRKHASKSLSLQTLTLCSKGMNVKISWKTVKERVLLPPKIPIFQIGCKKWYREGAWDDFSASFIFSFSCTL